MNFTTDIPAPLKQQAIRFLNNEYFDSAVYALLARKERNKERKTVLETLAKTEHEHALFWKTVTNQEPEPVSNFRIRPLLWMRRLAGLVFTMKFLERHEHEVAGQYRQWLPILDAAQRDRLTVILKDEEEHESYFMSQVDEAIVRYIGFVALGLSDAVIEISGVHAGFLGVMGSTLIAGVAGLIVGFAASISMAVAAYMKAKSEMRQSPIASALITGVSYLLAVILLAVSYFLTDSMITAFGVSIIFAILMSIGFTFYVSVVNETKFRREVIENTLLLIGTTMATYFFGDFVGKLFGIHAPV
ncbi:MAG TPA: VIT1/CCC1 family protein [Cyclobacteriaceae bacterium]|nr:VIT1/CCC1 family protein [Cyclobacteriaceae bacterium]